MSTPQERDKEPIEPRVTVGNVMLEIVQDSDLPTMLRDLANRIDEGGIEEILNIVVEEEVAVWKAIVYYTPEHEREEW